MATTEEWIEELKSISVLELAERIKAIEETFGVSAAAPVAVAGAPAGGGGGGGGGGGAGGQSALTPSRLSRLQHVLANGSGSPAADLHDAAVLAAPVSPLAGLVTVDSRDDPRVQVADLLAGVARRTVNTADEHLLAPFVSATSLRAPDS